MRAKASPATQKGDLLMIDESTMSWSKSLSCKDLGVARGHDLYITVPVADAESGFFPPVPITAAQKCEVDLPIRDSWGKS